MICELGVSILSYRYTDCLEAFLDRRAVRHPIV